MEENTVKRGKLQPSRAGAYGPSIARCSAVSCVIDFNAYESRGPKSAARFRAPLIIVSQVYFYNDEELTDLIMMMNSRTY